MPTSPGLGVLCDHRERLRSRHDVDADEATIAVLRQATAPGAMTTDEWQAQVAWIEAARLLLDRPEHRPEVLQEQVVRWAYVKGGDGAASLNPFHEQMMDPAPGRPVEQPPSAGTWSAYGFDAQDRLVFIEHHRPEDVEPDVTHRIHVDGDVMQLSRGSAGWRVERRSPADGVPQRHGSLSDDQGVRLRVFDVEAADPMQLVIRDFDGSTETSPRVDETGTLHARISTGGELVRLDWQPPGGGDRVLIYDDASASVEVAEPLPVLLAAWAESLGAMVVAAAGGLPEPATMLALQYSEDAAFGDDPAILTCEPIDRDDVFSLNAADWDYDLTVWLESPAAEELLPKLRHVARELRHDPDLEDPRPAVQATLHQLAALLNARAWPAESFAADFLVCPTHIELVDAEADLQRAAGGIP